MEKYKNCQDCIHNGVCVKAYPKAYPDWIKILQAEHCSNYEIRKEEQNDKD